MKGLLCAAALLAGCATTTLRADGRWTELRSDHFRVLTDVDPDAVAREVPRVEMVLAGLAARLRPDRPPPPRVDLMWLHDRGAIAVLGVRQARGYYLPHQGDEPSTPPLIVVAGAPGRELERALVHELAHVVFVDAAPGAPAWLAEGMAAWWDTLDVDRHNVANLDDGYLVMLYGRHYREQSMDRASIAALLTSGYDRFHDSRDAGNAYVTARSFVAMLQGDPELAPRLAAYIVRLRQADARAWENSFGDLALQELQARFDRFWFTKRAASALEPWRGRVTMQSQPPAVVERWLARARPWDSPSALDGAGRALGRAAADDSAERHYWCGVLAAAQARWSDAARELRQALARDGGSAMAASALQRVEARLRARP